jgi:hypothetical protein
LLAFKLGLQCFKQQKLLTFKDLKRPFLSWAEATPLSYLDPLAVIWHVGGI